MGFDVTSYAIGLQAGVKNADLDGIGSLVAPNIEPNPTSIKNAINGLIGDANETTGATDTDMTSAVDRLIDGYSQGGGSVEHGVFFLDYDGSIVEAWDSTSVASKTALPANPTHTGLIGQGWNWDLQHIKDYMAAYSNANIYVGQMYKTASGLTEMDITVTKVTGLTVTCNMSGNKNWGDGTTNSSNSHTYTDYGNYTITCDGTTIPSGSSSSGGLFGSSSSNVNRYWCTAIRIGASVTSIGDYAFNICHSLTTITISESVTSIGIHAFQNCDSLTTITIPQSVTNIDNYAFQYCYSLTSITIPQGVTRIGTYAFSNCYSLTTITIPQGVTSIGGYAFSGCYSLTTITIPQGVTSIGNYAFENCYSLTTITIPQGVTNIDNYTFHNCYSLTTITIPQSVTSIGAYAFSGCYSLTTITISESVTSIGNYAFNGCYSLTNITILQGVTSIGNSAFYACYSLIQYDFSSNTTIPTLSNVNAFSNINGICKILVPSALYETWKTATNWATYADYLYPV